MFNVPVLRPPALGVPTFITLALMLFLLGVATDASAQSTRNVVVITIGDDAKQMGVVQAELESAIDGARGFTLIPAGDVARILRVPTSGGPELNREQQARRARLLKQAENDFYMGKHDDALNALRQLADLQSKEDFVSTKERISTYLWYASVYLAVNDQNKARAAVNRALTLNPELEVDLAVFRPSLADLVDLVRGRGLRLANVTVKVGAVDARVFIDDRPARTGELRVPVGVHQFRVEAPGFQTLHTTVEVVGAQTITLTPPLLLPPQQEARLRAMIDRGSTSDADETMLEELSKRLDVDIIVISSVRSQPPGVKSAVWWWEESEPSFSSPVGFGSNGGGGLNQVVTWVMNTLRGDQGPTGRPDPPPRTPGALEVSARGGLAFSPRRYFLQSRAPLGPGETPGGHDVTFFGFGPRLNVEAQYQGFWGDVTVDFLTYGVLLPTVEFVGTGPRQINGGTTTQGALHAGYQLDVNKEILWLRGWTGFRVESHVTGANKTDTARFPGYQRTALDAGADVHYVVGPVEVSAGGQVSPVSKWTEVPQGTTGLKPKTALAYGWTAHALWSPRPGLKVRGEYWGEQRTINFSGESSTQFNPPMQDGLLQETMHLLLLSVDVDF